MPHDHHHHLHLHHQPGHNLGEPRAAQWQTPHVPHDNRPEPGQEHLGDEYRDLDLVEAAFRDGFATASDPTSFLRLAGVPFVGTRGDGRRLYLLRVEHWRGTDVGSITPRLGGGDFRYAPLSSNLASRRDELRLVYIDGGDLVPLTLAEARSLTPVPADAGP